MTAECPHCGTKYEVENNLYGRVVKCTECSKSFVVGQASKGSKTNSNAYGFPIPPRGIWIIIKGLVALSFWLYIVLAIVSPDSHNNALLDEIVELRLSVELFITLWFTKYCFMNDISELLKIIKAADRQ